MTDSKILMFGDCVLDEARRQLHRSGTLVHIGPRVLALIIALVRHRDRVLTRRELQQAVWPDHTPSDTAFNACLSRARAAIGDSGGAAPMIKTFARYGYRFVGKARIKAAAAGHDHDPAPSWSVPPAPAAQVGSTAGFVGRSAELSMLSDALGEALAGRGSLVFVSGTVGIGKTRLADELAQLAGSRGVAVLTGRCDEAEQPPPFWPWAQVMRAYVAHHDAPTIRNVLGGGAAEVARIAPALREHFPHLRASAASDPEHVQVRVLASLLAFVRRAASLQPLLVIFDDLQWADSASLRLLDACGRDLAGARALVVGVYGDTAVDPTVARLAATHAAAGPARHLLLRGLDGAAVHQLLDHACGQPVPDTVAASLAELTEGNPLFVLEMTRHLAESDLLFPARARWPLREEIEQAGLSAATCATVGRRLRHLSAGCMRTLAVAAVAGVEFIFDAVEATVQRTGDNALRGIEEAHAAAVVHPIDGTGGRYRFTHRLFREAIYQALNPTRRARLHAELSTLATPPV